MPYYIVGNGSNLLVSDAGYRGVIIAIGREMAVIEVHGCTIRAQAGALMSQIASAALEHKLAGFEFASGIPGTIGGAAVMNAGAYGGEMKDVIEKVTVLDQDGRSLVLSGGGAGVWIPDKPDYEAGLHRSGSVSAASEGGS